MVTLLTPAGGLRMSNIFDTSNDDNNLGPPVVAIIISLLVFAAGISLGGSHLWN